MAYPPGPSPSRVNWSSSPRSWWVNWAVLSPSPSLTRSTGLQSRTGSTGSNLPPRLGQLASPPLTGQLAGSRLFSRPPRATIDQLADSDDEVNWSRCAVSTLPSPTSYRGQLANPPLILKVNWLESRLRLLAEVSKYSAESTGSPAVHRLGPSGQLARDSTTVRSTSPDLVLGQLARLPRCEDSLASGQLADIKVTLWATFLVLGSRSTGHLARSPGPTMHTVVNWLPYCAASTAEDDAQVN